MAATKARRTEALADETMSPLQRLIHWWGDDATSGVSPSELEAFEARYAIRLPDDFRAYMMAVMPKGNDLDSEGTCWWALDRLKSVREECAQWEGGTGVDGDEKAIVFADYLIWCFAWAIDCSDGENRGKIILLTGAKNPCVAESFNQFLDRYIRDHHTLM